MDVLNKALRRENLTEQEALFLWEKVPLCDLAGAADLVRREAVSRGVPGGNGSAALDGNGSVAPGGNGSVAPDNADLEVVTWQIDRNVNITNVCISGCKFCNFHCRPGAGSGSGSEADGASSAEAGSGADGSFSAGAARPYILDIEDYIPRIEQTLALGGDQLLLQGGLHPRLGIDFYTALFSELKRLYPRLKLHALGPPEVAHIARISDLSVRETLERLVGAGLDSLPGAGAEILVDRVRRAISPAKPTVEQWLDVMREAHRMNLPTSATMMYGHIETPRDVVEHLLKIRDLQASRPEGTHGFVAFIPWIFRGAGTVLEREMQAARESGSRVLERENGGARERATGEIAVASAGASAGAYVGSSALGYLRVIAISRLILNNIRNIQASWLTVGKEVAQMALHSGANDMGSIMIEENVVASAGADNRFDAAGIQAAIREAGFEPRLRDQLYRFRS